MSARASPAHMNGARLETRSTWDERVPLSDDDRQMAHSWRMIPIPPDASGDWFIVDALLSDKWTVWGRWLDVLHTEGTA